MRKSVMILLLLVVAVVLVGDSTPAMATTEGEPTANTSIFGLGPFTALTNYMSLQGYLRWQTFEAEGVWLTPLEAVRAVKAQGAVPTLSCWDAMVLNGCRGPK